MARCTAPVRGHRSAAAAAACPACRYRSSYRYGGYGSSYSSSGSSGASYSSSGGGGGRSSGSSSSSRPRWSKAGSSVSYTPAQVQSLTPIRQTVETRAAEQPDLRDVFLCHAWDDRQGPAKELHELLVAAGVKVWFSEKDLPLGAPMMRAIDKGLANSRIGLVLVTPALLARLPKESIADKELSALLAGNQLIPIVHNTTYEDLR
ncbi:toll/interleukin-1 receptor domain-containing protein, partial [candidate division KSB1 bacterium]|nr:toll/interleukin-1 receptor domain-containing protein [candidate division KSB1 bacterium]